MKKLEAKNTEQVTKDKECAIAMQSGNKADKQNAFNQLHKRYKSPIFYAALRYVKMNEETAKDLTQEIFVKVWEKIDQYNFSTVFSTWLYTIAHNHLKDFKRKERVEVLSINVLSIHPDFSGDLDAGETPFQIEDSSVDTFNSVVRGERAGFVIDALNKGVKSADAREIISLIFLEDMSYDKVAQIKKMPLGTIKALMFRAKDEMKDYLSVKSRDFEYGRICTTKLKAAKKEEEAEC